MGSLWCAREYLNDNNVVLLNGDIVVSENMMRDIVCQKTERPVMLVDGSIKEGGDYNVQVSNGRIVVMGKDLDTCYGCLLYTSIGISNRRWARREYIRVFCTRQTGTIPLFLTYI